MLEGQLAKNFAEMKSSKVILTKVDALTPELHALLSNSAAKAIDTWKTEVGSQGEALLGKISR